MTSMKTRRRVLIVTASRKLYIYFTELLSPTEFFPILQAQSAGEAKRSLLSTPADLLIVDTPLPDEFGLQFAQNQADSCMGILLLVKSELFERIAYQAEDSGILTLQKPNSRQGFYSAVKLLAALNARLQQMETKNRSLQEKMADIRAVNRAKWLLIEKLGMREKDAHYFIEKQAMDTRLPRREIAANIIRTYDN